MQVESGRASYGLKLWRKKRAAGCPGSSSSTQVRISPQLKQLEHKGSHMLRRMWETLGERYIAGRPIDGQYFQLLPHDAADEITAEPTESGRARLVCDFLAGMTDGYASRTYNRLFSPDFGSIGDLIG